VTYVAYSFDDVQKKVNEIIAGRILVGHAVHGDLAVLKLVHPKEKIRDTALYEPFRGKYSGGRAPALKKIVEGELKVAIQNGEHDSV
jgi:RNA exonuclease 4